MTEEEFRAHVRGMVDQTRGSTAALARKHKVHPKALTLFLSGARGPSEELARAFGYRCEYVPLAASPKPTTVEASGMVERLRNLHDAATPGEWRVVEDQGSIWIDADDDRDVSVLLIISGSPHNQDRADAEFIIAAVEYALASVSASSPTSEQGRG